MATHEHIQTGPSKPPMERKTVSIIFGTTRYTVLIGQWAMKIPRLTSWRMFLYGLLGNMQERTWAGFSDRLCPIVAAVPGGWLLVMRRAAPLDDAMWEAWDRRAQIEFTTVDKTRLPVEYKRSSLGMLDGRVVAVDYAC